MKQTLGFWKPLARGGAIGAGVAVAGDVIDYARGKTTGTEFAANTSTSLISAGVGAVGGALAVAALPVTALS